MKLWSDNVEFVCDLWDYMPSWFIYDCLWSLYICHELWYWWLCLLGFTMHLHSKKEKIIEYMLCINVTKKKKNEGYDPSTRGGDL